MIPLSLGPELELTLVPRAGYMYKNKQPVSSSRRDLYLMMRTKLAFLLAFLFGLAVILAVGCDELVTNVERITIAGNPTAHFTNAPISGCMGDSGFAVLFKDQSSGQITMWIWDFGDGTIDTTTEVQIRHTYDTGGAFTVTLTVFDSVGSDFETQINAVTVNQAKARFSVSTDAGCAPLTVKFQTDTLSYGGITDWHWDFGNGDTSAASNPLYTFPDSGTYEVRMIVSSSICGSADTAYYTDSIRVINSVEAAFELAQVTGCVGDSMGFTNQSTNGGDGYKWFFGDGDSSLSENPKHVYDDTGVFTITLIAKCGANADTLILPDTLTIDSEPTAVIANLDDNSLVGSTITWTDSSTGSNILSTWDIVLVDSTYVSGPLVPLEFTFPEAGEWIFRLIAENSCSADTAYDTVAVTTP